MLLVKSGFKNIPSFSLIPLSADCNYAEMIFDPIAKQLILFSKHIKESLHTIGVKDENGNYKTNKKNAVVTKEIKLQTYQEYYIADESDVRTIIELYAVNSDTFELEEFFKKPSIKDSGKKSNLILPGQ